MKRGNFKLRPYTVRIQLGIQSFMKGIDYIMLLIACMFAPGVAFGATIEEDQEKLLKKIETHVEKLIKESAKENMNEVAVNKLIEKLNAETSKLTKESMEKLAETMKKLEESNAELIQNAKTYKEALDAQSIEIKKLKEAGVEDINKEKPTTFRKALEQAFMAKKDVLLSEKSDDYGKRLSLKGYFEKHGSRATMPEITIKAAVDLFSANIIGANMNNLRLTDLDPTRVSIPLAVYPHVLDVYQSKSIAKPYMALLVVWSYFDGAAIKAEGVAAAQSSFKFKTVIFPAFFIATYFNLSDETLDDLDEAMDEIAAVAPDKIMSAIDAQIDRAGGDDVASIKGILHVDKSTAYAIQMEANSVPSAYIVDVVADAILQIEAAKYMPNVVKMNPKTITLLAAAKNNMDDSKTDRRVAFDSLGQPTAVCGLRIIKSSDLAVNTMLILDNKQPWIGKRRDITMEIGYNGTDFVEGQKTVILKTRLAFGVRDNAAIVYVSDVAAAVVALNQV